IDRPINCSPHAASQADNLAMAIANAGDAVQCARNTGPIIIVKVTNAIDNLRNLLVRNFGIPQDALTIDVSGGGQTAEIHDDLKQLVLTAGLLHRHANTAGQGR
ncbi:MAG TPA: hypothetical protein PLC06_17385, partial [Promineifilum sp.]|nr:hypothetical protein [Promineifilum sp.]